MGEVGNKRKWTHVSVNVNGLWNHNLRNSDFANVFREHDPDHVSVQETHTVG